MKDLNEMIGKQVVVETVGKKETFGILTSVETLANNIYGHSYLISIDKEVIIPMHSIYKITLMERHERDKKEDKEKKKSVESSYQRTTLDAFISNLGL